MIRAVGKAAAWHQFLVLDQHNAAMMLLLMCLRLLQMHGCSLRSFSVPRQK